MSLFVAASLNGTEARFGEETVLIGLLVEHYGVTGVDLGASVISTSQLSVIPQPVARSHCVLPLARKGNELLCAVADPGQKTVLDEIAFASSLRSRSVCCLHTRVRRTIDAAYTIKKSGKKNGWVIEGRMTMSIWNYVSCKQWENYSDRFRFFRRAIGVTTGRSITTSKRFIEAPIVYIVDEDEEVVELLSSQLQSQDVEVITGHQGATVIAELEKTGPISWFRFNDFRMFQDLKFVRKLRHHLGISISPSRSCLRWPTDGISQKM